MDPQMLAPKGSRQVEGALLTNILTNDECPDLSIAHGALNGHHGPTRNMRSTRAYYVLDGSGNFTVGSQVFTAHAGHVVLVPRGTTHELDGVFEYLVLNTPAFRPEDETAGK